MKVWVVMGNDYPDSVYATEDLAEAFITQKKAEQVKFESWSQRPRIYWRTYEFEVQS